MNKFFDVYWNLIAKNFIRKPFIQKAKSEYNLKHTPSIIASNCIAGEIYNDLGLKFMSPTINLFLMQKIF